MKRYSDRLVAMLVLVGAVSLVVTPASAQGRGRNGTTLAASKTIDICAVDDNTWRYSGVISVWNGGAVATQGLTIDDYIQNKQGAGQFTNAFLCQHFDGPEIPAGGATTFTYSCESGPLSGAIRNSAVVTILNHSGSLGTPKGPNPKASWTGGTPPPCEQLCGCVHSQGYWGNKPGVVWPDGFSRDAQFFNSGKTWQEFLDAQATGNGYVILAKQYIAAVLNEASGACVPTGVQALLDSAEQYFQAAGTPGQACPLAQSCGLQKTWAAILDDYNNGEYPGGPAHCGDE